MLARLGNLFYWVGCGLAALSLILGVIGAVKDQYNPFGLLGLALLTALVFWGIGRGARYLFAGN